MKDEIKVGIIGFGSGARTFHAPFIASLPEYETIKIRVTKRENIASASAFFPNAVIVSSENELFSDPKVDLIVITAPNNFHFSLAKEALMAGKHVLVDKPFTATVEEAEELILIAKEKKKILTVFHNRRWDSDFKTIKKIVRAKLLGNLVEYEAHFDRFRNYVVPNTWKEKDAPAMGILYDLGTHLIDQVLVLFGSPESVHAHLTTQRTGAEIIDNFQLTLYYKNLRVLLKAGMLAREPGIRYILSGDEGSYVKYGLDVQEEDLKAGKNPNEKIGWGKEPEEIWGRINTNYNGFHWMGKLESEIGNYTDLYIQLAKAIKGEGEVPVPPEEAREVIRVVEAAIESNKEGRVINLKK